jgi:hypothetical protein
VLPQSLPSSVAEWAGVYGPYYYDLWNRCSFLIEEELLCKAQRYIGDLCHRVKIFAFQVTVHIGLLKEDYYV